MTLPWANDDRLTLDLAPFEAAGLISRRGNLPIKYTSRDKRDGRIYIEKDKKRFGGHSTLDAAAEAVLRLRRERII